MVRRHALIAFLVAAALAPEADAQSRFFGHDKDGTEFREASDVVARAARDAFFANLIGVGTEDFERFAGLGAAPIQAGVNAAPLALEFTGAGIATLTGTGFVRQRDPRQPVSAGRYPTSGVNYFQATLTRTATFQVAFSRPVAAFGFFATDLGDFGSDLTLQFFRGGSLIDSWRPYLSPFDQCNQIGNFYCGGRMFIGSINTATFDEVRFSGTDADDIFGFDDMTVGSLQQVITTPVPEPAPMALSAIALLGLLASARRRRVNRA